MLPGKDSFEICREFESRRRIDTPIVLLTARAHRKPKKFLASKSAPMIT